MNNKLLVGLNAILVVAVVVLFVLQFNKNGEAEVASVPVEENVEGNVDNNAEPFTKMGDLTSGAVVMYVLEDSLFMQWEFYKEQDRIYRKMMKDSQDYIMSLQKKLEDKARSLDQQKYLLSEEQLMKKQNEIVADQRAYQGSLEKEQQKMMDREMSIHDKIYDKITSYLKKLQAQKGYDYVVSIRKESGFLYHNTEFNVTQEVIEGLNKEYKASKK